MGKGFSFNPLYMGRITSSI